MTTEEAVVHLERITQQVAGLVVLEPIMEYFAFAHLTPRLIDVSCCFAQLALRVMELPRSAERSVALRKLLEGKDAAVRAAMVAP